MGGTYIRVKGRWTYLSRAVAKRGLTVDLLLSGKRDIAAAERFFSIAIRWHGAPEGITPGGRPATPSAIAEPKKDGVLRSGTKVRTSRYLNNLIAQAHPRVRRRPYPMLGFEGFGNAAVTISGIELVQQIKEGQFDTSQVAVGAGVPVAHIRDTVIAA